MISGPVSAQRLRDLGWLRRVRDRIDREYAQPLDVEARARGAHMSAGHFSRQMRWITSAPPTARSCAEPSTGADTFECTHHCRGRTSGRR